MTEYPNKLTLYGEGNVECPVGGCGCPWVKFLGVSMEPQHDGTPRVTLRFACEWDHEWSLSLGMHDGATLHTIEVHAELPDDEAPVSDSPADRIWRD